MNNLKKRLVRLLSPLGAVSVNGDFLIVKAYTHVAVGVRIAQTPAGMRLKVVVDRRDARRFLAFTGRMSVRPDLRIRLRRDVVVPVRASRNGRSVVWAPEEPVDEKIIQTCVLFASKVIANN
jgi:hypothetical protein